MCVSIFLRMFQVAILHFPTAAMVQSSSLVCLQLQLYVQVGIVLYRTLATFLHKRVTAGSVAFGFVSFIAVFLGSVLIGKHC